MESYGGWIDIGGDDEDEDDGTLYFVRRKLDLFYDVKPLDVSLTVMDIPHDYRNTSNR